MVAMMVTAPGSMMLQKVRKGPAPSTIAASSVSLGIPRKDWRKMKINRPFLMPKPVAERIKKGQKLSSKWRLSPVAA